ncbi:hypothetical protein U0070_025695, partial [Myodes glareolus]
MGHSSSPPIVDTVHGKVLGKYINLEGFAQPVAVFLGVPFAKPPLGSLRFAPPQPAEPWNFVEDATSYLPMCSQDPVTGRIVNDLLTNRKESVPLQFSEDCLYLNIYTPADLKRSHRLPVSVMVWIHGGGLVLGGASTYDGLVLSAHENVVVVVIQYRLGIWGFLRQTQAINTAWGTEVTWTRWLHCTGFRTTLPALEETQALSQSSESQREVLSPLAKNLFYRAVSESGVALTAGLVKKNARPLAEKTEEELWETVLKLNLFKLDLHGDSRQSHPFIPTIIDGVVLPKMPEEILAEKNFNTVPYIVGINKQEFGWILPTMMSYPPLEVKLDQKTATSLLQKSSFILSMNWRSHTNPMSVVPFLNLPEDKIPVAIEKYLRDTDDPDRSKDQLLELIGDVVFGVPSVVVSRGHRDAGAPTYMYEFQYCPSFSPEMKPSTVVGDHGDEVDSVFGAPILRGGASEEEISLRKMVMKFWVNFAQLEIPMERGCPIGHSMIRRKGTCRLELPPRKPK